MSFQLPILRRIDKDDSESIDHATADGFDFIGTLHTYSLDIPIYHFPVEIREARKNDFDEVLAIGLSELRHSRLYMDPKIPFEVAQSVYRDRIKLAFHVSTILVAGHIGGEGIVGFCTLLDKEIELIAVKSERQGIGIGRKLIDACIDVSASRGDKTLVVKTQGSNRQARNFYEKCGFNRTQVQKDFHRYEDTADG